MQRDTRRGSSDEKQRNHDSHCRQQHSSWRDGGGGGGGDADMNAAGAAVSCERLSSLCLTSLSFDVGERGAAHGTSSRCCSCGVDCSPSTDDTLRAQSEARVRLALHYDSVTRSSPSPLNPHTRTPLHYMGSRHSAYNAGAASVPRMSALASSLSSHGSRTSNESSACAARSHEPSPPPLRSPPSAATMTSTTTATTTTTMLPPPQPPSSLLLLQQPRAAAAAHKMCKQYVMTGRCTYGASCLYHHTTDVAPCLRATQVRPPRHADVVAQPHRDGGGAAAVRDCCRALWPDVRTTRSMVRRQRDGKDAMG